MVEDATTIKVSVSTKTSLDLMKVHPRQSYDEVIRKRILELNKLEKIKKDE